MQENERAAQYSTRRFHSHSTHCACGFAVKTLVSASFPEELDPIESKADVCLIKSNALHGPTKLLETTALHIHPLLDFIHQRKKLDVMLDAVRLTFPRKQYI